ncbi:MAG TPA: hypothetical protein PKO15_06045 [Fibrobacteria bacterium]|nr:hypothetical protein [Fibrobacteria bacterium]HOX52736.1 hypothetical protein [Fibrobacteria bacterium]
MQKTICFAYHSGEPSGTSRPDQPDPYLVFAAVMVRESELGQALEGAERIRHKFFADGRISSDALGADSESRRKVVAMVANLPIQIVVLAIEREELLGDPEVPWQKAFFQYISRLLFAKLISSFQPLEIVQSPDSDPRFRFEFEIYIERNLSGDLFSSVNDRYRFALSDEVNRPLMGVADFLGGTYLRILARQETPEFDEFAMGVLQESIIYIDHWPPKFKHKRIDTIPDCTAYATLDENLETYCLRGVNEFLSLDRLEGLDEAGITECKAFLRFLLQQLDSGARREYVATKRIQEFLSRVLGREISVHHLRERIVGTLQDQGVILASGPKGYKIPTCYKDIHTVVSQGNSVIPTLVARLKFAKDAIRVVSFGQRDILDEPEFAELRRIVNAIQR